MKAYLEYLELFEYFGRQSGGVRLERDAFLACDDEFSSLVARRGALSAHEQARLGELKAMLMRDKP